MSDESVELVRRSNEAFNRDGVPSISSSGFWSREVVFDFRPTGIPGLGVYNGYDEIRRFFEEDWFGVFPSADWVVELEELIDHGHRVIAVSRQRGRGSGSGAARSWNSCRSSRCGVARSCATSSISTARSPLRPPGSPSSHARGREEAPLGQATARLIRTTRECIRGACADTCIARAEAGVCARRSDACAGRPQRAPTECPARVPRSREAVAQRR
jgi:hypothetical protein